MELFFFPTVDYNETVNQDDCTGLCIKIRLLILTPCLDYSMFPAF